MQKVPIDVEVKLKYSSDSSEWPPDDKALQHAIDHDTKVVAELLESKFGHLPSEPSSAALRKTVSLASEFSVENLQAHLAWRKGDLPRIRFYGADHSIWLITISIPLSALLTSFMAEAGKDAYKVCKTLFGKLSALRYGDTSVETEVEIHDSAGTPTNSDGYLHWESRIGYP